MQAYPLNTSQRIPTETQTSLLGKNWWNPVCQGPNEDVNMCVRMFVCVYVAWGLSICLTPSLGAKL